MPTAVQHSTPDALYRMPSVTAAAPGDRPGEQSLDAATPAVSEDLQAPVRVMVVDDDVTVLGLIEDVLAGEADIELEAYHESSHALERLRQTDFEIIITDLKMPRVDGLALLHELRRLRKDALVIVITGYATMESCLEAMRLGAYDYLTKPFRMDEFLHTVHNSVERVRSKRHTRAVENKLEDVSRRLAAEEQQSARLRARVAELEDDNAALQQLLQRAGIPTAAPAPSLAKARSGAYPRFAERPTDRISREIERLNQLEESGVISAHEADRARRKIQES